MRSSIQLLLQGSRCLAALAGLFLASGWCAKGSEPSHSPSPALPSPVCDSIEVPEGHRPMAHLYALGFQIYRWTGTTWEFVAPQAALYADRGYRGQIGTHYGGPTWEAMDGSRVVAARDASCTPFPGAIPWLRLVTVETSDRGRFSQVSYIQRLDTIGGTAPAEPGTTIGELAHVPYTAEYVMYRAFRGR